MEDFSWLSDQGCRILVDHLQDGIFVIDREKLVYANQHLADMFGYELGDLIGQTFIDLIAAEDRAMAMERYLTRLKGEYVPAQYEVRIIDAHGTQRSCSLNVSLMKNQEGRAVTIGSARDITRQKEELAKLEASRHELQSIFDQLPDVFYRTDMQGIITMISPFCFKTIGYSQEEMLGTPMAGYYKTPEDRQKIVQAITKGSGKAIQVEAALKHKDGSTIWVSTNAFVRLDEKGKPSCIEGVARDISARKRMEDRLTTLSRTDSLTGVYNRQYFMDQSEEVIKVMRRYKHPASMMLADLDHFKSINDRYGHHAGDLALNAFVQVCRETIRESDIFGRMGGEEFAITLPETPLQSAAVLAERIRKATAEMDITLDGQTIKLTVSIGLVELSAEDQSLKAILHRADQAMYQAKEKGRNRVVTAVENS